MTADGDAFALLEHVLADQYAALRVSLPDLELPPLARLEARRSDEVQALLVLEVEPRAAASMIQKVARMAAAELAPGLHLVGVELVSVVGSGLVEMVCLGQPVQTSPPPDPQDVN